ncbi:PREDICTED: uncharacterized protein LOC106330230 [Brassica oleracea var. oleracea]|uniref:uncharacterized protein LOC106330230 n=1 Tax=Brassica oleracea var. oleracea TaxID=109376 RepID=UPI0006A6E130|nr:PREDICTED: uncharacterized protein LOC106330230 [Brassica oleracea var. oleracea]
MGNVFPWISWHLWTTRNKLIFDSRSTTPHEVVVQSICAMRDWESSQSSLPSAALKQLPPTPPPIIPTATIFCNTDAAWKSDFNSAGLAWIFSDQSGLEIASSSSAQDHVASPCMAEAIAIRDALLHAASLNYSHICLRTDSQVIAQAINRRSSTMKLYGYQTLTPLSFQPLRLLFFASLFSFPVRPMGLQTS